MTKNTVSHDNCSSSYNIMLMFLCVFYIDDVFPWWHHQLVIMAVRFLWPFHRSSISNVSFFVLTKRWLPILLSKLSENYAVFRKMDNVYIYVNFGLHGPLIFNFCSSRKATYVSFVCWCQVSGLRQDLQMKEKQYEVKLQAVEDSHRQMALELREMLTAQQQMSAKYVHSILTLSFVFCILCFLFFILCFRCLNNVSYLCLLCGICVFL